MIGEGKESIKTVFEEIGVLRVFVKNEAGDLDVADLGVKDGRFT